MVIISVLNGGVEPLDDLGEAKLEVDPNVSPRALPCRKAPVALQDEAKPELDKLVKRSVVIPVSEPTKWISQMATVMKANRKLRSCIDPQCESITNYLPLMMCCQNCTMRRCLARSTSRKHTGM